MRIRISLVFVGTIIYLISLSSVTLGDSSFSLPNSLVFSTTKDRDSGGWNMLVRVDANTEEITPFFTGPAMSNIRAVSWSPQGNKLAITVMDSTHNKLCTLNRDGYLEICFEAESIVDSGFLTVTWSSDGRYAYFVEYVESTASRLVEVDVTTGATRRVVYTIERTYAYTPTWTASLSHIAFNLGLGSWDQDIPRLLVDLESNVEIDMRMLVPQSLVFLGSCPLFSPLGSYLVLLAEDKDNSAHALLVVDMEGKVRHIIQSTPEIHLDEPNCPVWNDDESILYFSDRNGISKYVLANHVLASFHSGAVPIYDGFQLSPQGEAIVGFSEIQLQILVVDHESIVELLGEPYEFGLYPIWEPPNLLQ